MKLVPYYRVSTSKQARSGLGLEGQEATVSQFANAHGAQVLKSYIEVETGKWSERPELAKAVAHARRAKATLVIAKLDRLARNVHFLSGLMEAGVKFLACDQPSANDLTIHILAAVAQDEAQRINVTPMALMRVATCSWLRRQECLSSLVGTEDTRRLPILLRKRVPPEVVEKYRRTNSLHRNFSRFLQPRVPLSAWRSASRHNVLGPTSAI